MTWVFFFKQKTAYEITVANRKGVKRRNNLPIAGSFSLAESQFSIARTSTIDANSRGRVAKAKNRNRLGILPLYRANQPSHYQQGQTSHDTKAAIDEPPCQRNTAYLAGNGRQRNYTGAG